MKSPWDFPHPANAHFREENPTACSTSDSLWLLVALVEASRPPLFNWQHLDAWDPRRTFFFWQHDWPTDSVDGGWTGYIHTSFLKCPEKTHQLMRQQLMWEKLEVFDKRQTKVGLFEDVTGEKRAKLCLWADLCTADSLWLKIHSEIPKVCRAFYKLRFYKL